MDKYFKIQKLVEVQKNRKENLEKVFLSVLGFLPKMEIEFKLDSKRKDLVDVKEEEIFFIIKIKIKDKSSIKFVVNQHKQKILEDYSKIFTNDVLVIF